MARLRLRVKQPSIAGDANRGVVCSSNVSKAADNKQVLRLRRDDLPHERGRLGRRPRGATRDASRLGSRRPRDCAGARGSTPAARQAVADAGLRLALQHCAEGGLMSDAPEFNRVLTIDEIARYLRFGGPAGLEAVLEHYGALSARLAMLRIVLEDRLLQPRTKNYPPAVFVAYKWEDGAHNPWVRAAGGALRGPRLRGAAGPGRPRARRLQLRGGARVHRPTSGNVFLAVVTERYLELVEERENQTSWVFDEYEVASRLPMRGRLKIVAVWKEATVRPDTLLLQLNAIDMRQ
jgi:hypothetical protein